jgi:hypothetical protein
MLSSLSLSPYASPFNPRNTHEMIWTSISTPPSPSAPGFNDLVAPNDMFAKALNCNLNLQRFKVLYICGTTPAS